jgi:hypothetical protein
VHRVEIVGVHTLPDAFVVRVVLDGDARLAMNCAVPGPSRPPARVT